MVQMLGDHPDQGLCVSFLLASLCKVQFGYFDNFVDSFTSSSKFADGPVLKLTDLVYDACSSICLHDIQPMSGLDMSKHVWHYYLPFESLLS